MSATDFDNIFFKPIFYLLGFFFPFGKVGFIFTTVKACYFCQDTLEKEKGKKKKGTKAVMEVENI